MSFYYTIPYVEYPTFSLEAQASSRIAHLSAGTFCRYLGYILLYLISSLRHQQTIVGLPFLSIQISSIYFTFFTISITNCQPEVFNRSVNQCVQSTSNIAACALTNQRCTRPRSCRIRSTRIIIPLHTSKRRRHARYTGGSLADLVGWWLLELSMTDVNW